MNDFQYATSAIIYNTALNFVYTQCVVPIFCCVSIILFLSSILQYTHFLPFLRKILKVLHCRVIIMGSIFILSHIFVRTTNHYNVKCQILPMYITLHACTITSHLLRTPLAYKALSRVRDTAGFLAVTVLRELVSQDTVSGNWRYVVI